MVNGRFMITKSIGKGSFGEIFQGLDTATNKKVAIKMVGIIIRIYSFDDINIQIELDQVPYHVYYRSTNIARSRCWQRRRKS
jgi:serine/threonine protein kinase